MLQILFLRKICDYNREITSSITPKILECASFLKILSFSFGIVEKNVIK